MGDTPARPHLRLPGPAALAAGLLCVAAVSAATALVYIGERHADLLPLIFPGRYGIVVRRELPPVLPPDEKPAAAAELSSSRAATLFSEARSEAAQSSARFQAEFQLLHPDAGLKGGRSDPAVMVLPPGTAADDDGVAPGPGLAGVAARKVRPGDGAIRYGAAVRGQIMSRGAGPVLNVSRDNARRALAAGSKRSSGAAAGAASGVSGSGAAGSATSVSAPRGAAASRAAKDAAALETGRPAEPGTGRRKALDGETASKEAAKAPGNEPTGGQSGAPPSGPGVPTPPDPKALMDQILDASRQAVDGAAGAFNAIRQQGAAVSQQAVDQGRQGVEAAAKDAPKPAPPPGP